MERRAAWWAGGHRVRLLKGGDELFPAMHRAIDAAQHEVWLATYIFYDDALARTMAHALARAAARGVRVGVVVDGFGSGRRVAKLREWLAGTGVDLAVFRPLERWWSWLLPGQMRRLHTKLCSVDGEVAFVGGINIIDDRWDVNHGATPNPRLDFAVELRGPVAQAVAHTVRALWSRATMGADLREEAWALLRSAEPLQHARDLLHRLQISAIQAPRRRAGDTQPPIRVALVIRDNLRQRRAIERVYVDALNAAREKVDLVCSYFYPGQRFRRALISAARRGVKVRVLLQGQVDYRIAGFAARVMYDEMLGCGIRIHEYMQAFLHAKAAVVDDAWSTVGSSNIDPMSLLLNLEANVVVDDTTFANDVRRAFDEALQQSREVTVSTSSHRWVTLLGQGLLSWLAHWYLRLAGISGRY